MIGAGNMATALIKGMVSSGACERETLRASDPDGLRRSALEREFGIVTSENNGEIANWAEVVILAVKPQTLSTVLPALGKYIVPPKLVISVAAGVPCEAIEVHLPAGVPVVRGMPNMPALVLAGATGIAGGRHASEADLDWAKELFSVVGCVVVVKEALLDVVTGLSGSGPAYVLLVIEALADGAVKMGLPKAQALELATSTVLGTAQLLQQTGEHPARLKDQVTSPGGTTIAGLFELENGGARAILMKAVEAATLRAQQLGAAMLPPSLPISPR